MGYPVEGYSDAMRFYARMGIVDANTAEKLVRLAKLRNLLVHRYWVVDDERIVREARGNGIECIRRVLHALKGLLGQG